MKARTEKAQTLEKMGFKQIFPWISWLWLIMNKFKEHKNLYNMPGLNQGIAMNVQKLQPEGVGVLSKNRYIVLLDDNHLFVKQV